MDQIYLWMLGVLSTWHVLLHLLRVLLNTLSGCTLLRYLDPFHPCTPGTPQYVRWLHFTQVPRYITSLYSRYFNMSGGYTLLRYLDTFHPCTLGTPQYVKWFFCKLLLDLLILHQLLLLLLLLQLQPLNFMISMQVTFEDESA